MTKNFIIATDYVFCPDDVLYVIRHDKKDWNADHTEMIWYSRIRFNGGEGIIFDEKYFNEVAKALANKNIETKNDTSKG